MTNLPDRLKRYSKKAISDVLDPDFADAVWEAADEIEDMTYDIDCFNDEITAMFGTDQALLDFAHFVAEEVVVDGDEWAYEQFSFPELVCRRLYKLGIIEEEDGKWVIKRATNRRKDLPRDYRKTLFFPCRRLDGRGSRASSSCADKRDSKNGNEILPCCSPEQEDGW